MTGGELTINNRSKLPIEITLQGITPVGGAPALVGPNDEDWKTLSVADTRRCMALGLRNSSSPCGNEAIHKESVNSIQSNNSPWVCKAGMDMLGMRHRK